MAQKEGKCGTATVKYDERCSWSCMCDPKQACQWEVACPDGKGGFTSTTGTGRVNGHVSHPTVTVDGNLAALAAFLSKMWDRPVSAPSKVARERVERTVSGSQEEIVHALGLQLRANVAGS
jgi:hypothetical protein